MRATTFGIVAALLCPAATGQVHLQKFTAAVPAWNDHVGLTVAVDGDALAIARPGSDVGAISDRGAVLVYRWSRGAWSLEQEVVAPDGGPWDELGRCALSGDTLVVGAPHDDIGAALDVGSVHVFRLVGSSWVQTQVLLAADGDADDRFGSAVALRDDVLVVGAPRAGVAPNQGGRVYLYRWNGSTWSWEQSFGAGGDATAYGTWIGINDGADEIAVGAPEVGGSILTQGFVRILRHDGSSWSQVQTIGNPDFQSWGEPGFGRVALRGDLLVIGSPGFGSDGRVYAYVRDGSSFEFEEYFSSNGPDEEHLDLGSSIAISGDQVAIGAPGAVNENGSKGAVFVYRWTDSSAAFEFRLGPNELTFWGNLGAAVAFDGPLILAGSDFEMLTTNATQGSATVFSVMAPAWTYQGGGLAGLHGVPDLTARGTLAPGSSVSLALREARESALLALFVGITPLNAPFKGGTLVPNPLIIVPGLMTNPAGELTLGTTWPPAIPAGASLWLQAWIQDPAGAAGWAATNALRATQP